MAYKGLGIGSWGLVTTQEASCYLGKKKLHRGHGEDTEMHREINIKPLRNSVFLFGAGSARLWYNSNSLMRKDNCEAAIDP